MSEQTQASESPADDNRCVSVHWSLPVQCVLPSSHRENWHEAWHPETGNRLRYRYPGSLTEELHHGEWHPLFLPKPGDPITTADQLRALPSGAVLLDGHVGHGSAPVAWQIRGLGSLTHAKSVISARHYQLGNAADMADLLDLGPFRVLHTPGGNRG